MKPYFRPWGENIFGCLAITFSSCLSYNCPPSFSSFLWFIGLTAFLDISSKKKQIWSLGACCFVSILAACQVCNFMSDWIPRWTEAISTGQTDESNASDEISAAVGLSGQNNVGELGVKEIFGLDAVSLLLMHKAETLFRRPLTFWGRAKPVKQRLSEYLPCLTKRGACRSNLIIQDLGLARKNKRHQQIMSVCWFSQSKHPHKSVTT